jgi:hypothetical protein
MTPCFDMEAIEQRFREEQACETEMLAAGLLIVRNFRDRRPHAPDNPRLEGAARILGMRSACAEYQGNDGRCA